MANDNNKSIIKEALVDFETIQQAAEANAKKKLAEEFPDKFNSLLKEELNKNKKTLKESYKKLDKDEESEKSDDSETNKESDMKNQEKETKKVVKEEAGSSKPFGEKPKGVQKVAEDVKITDTVGKGEPFKEKAKAKEKDMLEEEREKDFTADVESKTPNIGKGEAEKGKIYNEKLKGPTSGKPISNLTEEFDISELDTSSVDNAMNSAGPNDEVLTMEEIEREIGSMEGLGEELAGVSAASTGGGDVLSQLKEMRDKLDGMIQGNMGEQKNNGGQGANQVNPGGPTQPMIDELGVYEQKNNGGQGANKVNAGGPTQPMIDEDPMVTEEDIQNVLGAGETPVDETMSISYSAGTITPGKLGDHEGTHGRFRNQGTDESVKKISALIKENKSLTKKLNEVKKLVPLTEQYKVALDKYRNQLKEMAVFNTNLAHVNNLLVNEELALTQDDKIKIINEFKKVDSIADSQKKYKSVLTEMKESKKTLTESIEEKVSVSVQPSSKQKLDEVTAYKDDKHIQKMRSLIEYVERRDKKIIK
jgi:hypothetical protein